MASDPQQVLSSDRIAETRRAIHQHLQQANVYGNIRSILAAYAADHEDFNPNSPEEVMQVLRERGIVQQVLGSLGDGPQRSVPTGAIAAGAGGSVGPAARGAQRTALYVRLAGGRAFLDNFDAAVLESRRKRHEQMVVHLHFGGQRFRSTPLPVSCDPAFDDDFLINFEPSIRELIDCTTPLHVLVTSEEASGAKCRTVGQNFIEWRKVFKRGSLNLAVELAGVNPGVPSGVLDMQLEIIPFTKRYSDDDIQYRLEQTASTQSACDREFLVYARRWWGEYHAIRPSHAKRRVKVFAQSLTGRMLPVTHYVDVMLPDRVFDGPEDAARFVSLLGVDSPNDDAASDMLSGLRTGPAEQWLSAFAFLCQRRGDSPNHATLLTSLLRGFGLDAYCVVGASAAADLNGAVDHKDTRLMVITRQRVDGDERTPNAFCARLWDPTTAAVYDLLDVEDHQLATIDCVFNEDSICANVQENARVDAISLDFDDEACWKSMNKTKLRMVPRSAPTPPLLWIPNRTRQIELELESRLKEAVTRHRDTLSCSTRWDDDLAVLFNQALAKYEASRRDSATPTDLTNFSLGVKGKLGDGRSFKGFPINVTHTSETRVVATVLESATGRGILECDAEETFLSLRCRVWLFPEGVMSVWIMFGARFRNRMT